MNNRFTPGMTRWVNVDLASLLEETYRLKDYQLEGGPAWIKSDRWDIEGKAAGPANSSEMSVMMRALLADRFQLRFHLKRSSGPSII